MLLESVDFFRLDANRKLDPELRSDLGQIMMPTAAARLMASMFVTGQDDIKLLDTDAGVDSITAAFASEVCGRPKKPDTLCVTVYEIDLKLSEYLASVATTNFHFFAERFSSL